MKSALKKLVYLALVLAFLSPAPCALAARLDTEKINLPSAQWEARFLELLEQMKLTTADKPTFTVTEYPERALAFRFEHTLEVNQFAKVSYYDDGNGNFNSAVLTMSLDSIGTSADPVWNIILATTLAGDPRATPEQVFELVNTICPIFNQILAGEKRVSGLQIGTLHGIGYGLEFYEGGRFARFFANAELTQK